MTVINHPSAPARLAPTGFIFLAIMSLGAGINWPVQKTLLSEWPPMSSRGLSGLTAALILAVLAVSLGQSLRVPRAMWPRILLSAFLNITSWVLMMGFALMWLGAGEAAILAYTMPAWASILAWPVLGERPTPLRLLALAIAFAGLVLLMGGDGVEASLAKLPGIVLALLTAFTYALGTVMLKRLPIALPPVASAAWQLGLGCLPVAILGLLIDRPDVAALSSLGWALLAYNVLIQQCLGYVCWLAALHRLPASVAAIGTMLVPVIGVVASSVALDEPLGPAKLAALALTVVGVVLAARS